MRIRQIVFAAHDLAAARAQLAQLLELPTPYRDPGVGEFGLDNAVFCFGDQFIEVVSPLRADSACSRHLARHGDSGYMLILQTDDLARARTRWDALGVRRVWSRDLPDISATHLHPKDVGAAIVSVDEPRPAASWRWGGPDWAVQPGAAGRQRVRGVRVRAVDPRGMAQRWAEVFDLPAPQAADGAWRLALDQGHVDFTLTDDGREGITGFTLAVAEPDAVRQRAAPSGCTVADDCVRLLGTELTLQVL